MVQWRCVTSLGSLAMAGQGGTFFQAILLPGRDPLDSCPWVVLLGGVQLVPSSPLRSPRRGRLRRRSWAGYQSVPPAGDGHESGRSTVGVDLDLLRPKSVLTRCEHLPRELTALQVMCQKPSWCDSPGRRG